MTPPFDGHQMYCKCPSCVEQWEAWLARDVKKIIEKRQERRAKLYEELWGEGGE